MLRISFTGDPSANVGQTFYISSCAFFLLSAFFIIPATYISQRINGILQRRNWHRRPGCKDRSDLRRHGRSASPEDRRWRFRILLNDAVVSGIAPDRRRQRVGRPRRCAGRGRPAPFSARLCPRRPGRERGSLPQACGDRDGLARSAHAQPVRRDLAPRPDGRSTLPGRKPAPGLLRPLRDKPSLLAA